MTDSRSWRREWGPLLLLWVALLPLFTPRLYAADEIKYFVHLRSLWFDGDVHYFNEYDHFVRADPEAWGWLTELRDPVSPTGRRLNDAPIGSAVLWAPFYIAADALVRVARGVGATVPRDGYSWPYVWAVCIGSLFWATAGLVLCTLSARRIFGMAVARWAVAGIWLASPLVFYMYITPPMAHANSVFAVSLFLWLWLRGRGGPRSIGAWVGLGAAAGLMALVRELNWLMLLPLLVDEGLRLVDRLRGRRLAGVLEELPGYLAFGAALAVMVVPQFLVYWLLHRTLGPTPFVVKKFSALPIHAHEVLFSGFHGLFSWHPVTLLAVVGLGFLARRDGRLALGLAVAVLAQIAVIGSYDTWWGGASFGARRFLNCTPIFVIGLGGLVAAAGTVRWRRLAHGVLVFLVLWNFGLALQYAVGMIPRDRPVAMSTIARNQFVEVPGRIAGVAWRFLTDRWSLVENPPVDG